MATLVQRAAAGALGLLIGSILLNILPEINTSSDVVNAINDPLAQLLLITIIVYASLTSGLSWLISRPEVERRSVSFPYQRNSPSRGIIVGEIRYEGVKWPFVWGETRGEFHGWVDHPNCPKCGNGLDSDKKRRRIRSDKQTWNCPACGFSTTRGDITEQRRSVQKIVEREGDLIISGLISAQKDDVRSMLENIEDRATEHESEATLSLHELNSERDDAEQEAIQQAIDEVVSPSDLQNSEKVLVLDHLLGQDFQPRSQYEIQWWEADEPGLNRAINHRTN